MPLFARLCTAESNKAARAISLFRLAWSLGYRSCRE